MFIADKLSSDSNQPNIEIVQRLMLKSLLRVAKAYSQHNTNFNLDQTFPPTLLDCLLKISVAPDTEIRLLAQQILQVLLTRSVSLKISKATITAISMSSASSVSVSASSSPAPSSASSAPMPAPVATTKDSLSLKHLNESEVRFLRKLHFSVYENYLLPSNTTLHFQALYNTHAMLLREYGYYEMLDLIKLLFTLQNYTDEQNEWSSNHCGVVHAFIAALFKLSARLSRNRSFFKYVLKVRERSGGDLYIFCRVFIFSFLYSIFYLLFFSPFFLFIYFALFL